MSEESTSESRQLTHERLELLQRFMSWLETPMLVLAFFWLALLVAELIWGLTPLLEAVGTIIWVLFIAEFCLGFVVAPFKLAFLRQNWLTAIALLLPALRLFRILGLVRAARLARVAGATRGVRLVRVVTSLNRGMRAFGASMSRRGFGYVVGLTLLVTLVGAAGMYAFERENPDGRGLRTYGAALWWTAMVMTTMGSEYWPQTVEGRILCFLLSLYAFAVFGYLTASLATYFIGRDAEGDAEVAGSRSVNALHDEIAALRAELRALTQRLASS